MNLISLLLLIASPLAGGLIVYQLHGRFNSFFKSLLIFCGGFLFATAVLHLLPEVFSTRHRYEGLLVMVGFFLQLLLEKMSQGVEHGHLHLEQPIGHDHGHHHHLTHPHTSWGLLTGLSIHSLLEGMPLNGMFSLEEPVWSNPLLLGVILHKFPSAFALATVLIQSKYSQKKQWFMLLTFVLMTPAGALLGKAILAQGGGGMDEFFHTMLALATGSFLQISTTILFESSTHHKFSLQSILFAFTGALLAYLM